MNLAHTNDYLLKWAQNSGKSSELRIRKIINYCFTNWLHPKQNAILSLRLLACSILGI